MALEDVDVQVDLDDDTLTVIPTPGTVESGNAASLVVSNAGDGDGADSRAGVGADVGVGGGVRVGDGAGVSEKGQFEKKERQKTSKVWNDFVSVKIGGVKKSQCNWCKKLFVVGKSSTISTLGRHLASCVRYVEFHNSKKQRTLSFEPSRECSDHDGFGSLTTFSYKDSRFRELAAHMVLLHEYPFNMMEHEFF
jgi:hypothetical protein